VLVEAPTVREFAKRLRRKPDALGATLTPLQREGSQPPVFFVAGGGGLGVAFVPVARKLGPDQPSWALQTYGMERRGIPDWTVRRAARRHLRTLRTVQPHGPYYLAGHSFGGLLAYEMTLQLEAAGEQVALLTLLDSFPPNPDLHPRPEPRPLPQRIKEFGSVAMAGILSAPGTGHYWRFYDLASRMGRRYRPGPWGGRALVVLADSPEREIRAQWADHLTGQWEVVSVGGDHLSMLRDPFAAEVADVLKKALAQVRGA
jgi:thioesterase domain-containing protein